MKKLCNSFLLAKFGGKSISNFESMSNIINIIISNPSIKLIILSASEGVTDILFSLSKENKKSIQRYYIERIRNMQYNIIRKLRYKFRIKNEIDEIINKIEVLINLKKRINFLELTDKLMSYGEIISTKLFVEMLHQKNILAIWFDIRKIMITDDKFGNAKPNNNLIKNRTKDILLPKLKRNLVVTQGFIGKEIKRGRTTTLGRGGSDYTASLLGEALSIKRIDIWKDVSGIYTTDPKIFPKAKLIKNISFKEVLTMANFGAKIIHPLAILPAERNSIPIFIRSSIQPNIGGTMICKHSKNKPLFRSLVFRKNQMIFTLYNKKTVDFYTFKIKIQKIINKYNFSIELFHDSIFNISFIINKNLLKNLFFLKLKNELSYFCKIEINKSLALVSIIGNKLKNFYFYIKKKYLISYIFTKLKFLSIKYTIVIFAY